jgi:hypothetical protein
MRVEFIDVKAIPDLGMYSLPLNLIRNGIAKRKGGWISTL